MRIALRKPPPSGDAVAPLGCLDVPRPGAAISATGVLAVGGWAADARGSLAVELEIDGTVVDRCRLGIHRPDVGAALGAHAALAGWECYVDPTPHAVGRTRLRIEAFAQTRDGGRAAIGAVEVAIDDSGMQHDDAHDGARRAELRCRTAQLLGHWAASSASAAAGVAAAATGGGRLKILVVMHALTRGGSQLIVLERLRELVAARAVEAVVVTPVDGQLRADFEAIGVRCHLTATLTPPDAFLYEGRIAELAMWCRPQGFDLVVANTMASSAAIDLAERLGLPSLWLVYEEPLSANHLSQQLATTWPAYAIEQANDALRRCSLIVFDSEARRRDYLHRARPERLLTIPGAVDLVEIERFRATFDRRAARRARGIPESATLILLLGSILRLKGTPLLVQAFATLAAERSDLRLALVGSSGGSNGGSSGGPLAKALADYAAARGLEDRVSIEPMGPDAYTWLGMADLLVCPSDRESMPRTVLEGMAFEVPVLATAVGDLPSVIVDGTTGWLIAPSDPMALERGLRRALATPPEERRAIVAAALRAVRGHRDSRHAAASFAAAIERVAASARELSVCEMLRRLLTTVSDA